MENMTTITKDVILDKKMESYAVNTDNFIASGEITVTITLSEYRELVTKTAASDTIIQKARNDKLEKDNRIKELENEVRTLKDKLYEMLPVNYKKEDE